MIQTGWTGGFPHMTAAFIKEENNNTEEGLAAVFLFHLMLHNLGR